MRAGDAVVVQDPCGHVGFGAVLAVNGPSILVCWQNGRTFSVRASAVIPAERMFKDLVGDQLLGPAVPSSPSPKEEGKD